jgi:hypothetical protein
LSVIRNTLKFYRAWISSQHAVELPCNNPLRALKQIKILAARLRGIQGMISISNPPTPLSKRGNPSIKLRAGLNGYHASYGE